MTQAAQRLPNVSPARLARLKSALGLLQALSPRLAAHLAFYLFLRPQRRELADSDAPFMATARLHRLQAGADFVQVYEWGTAARTLLIVHGWGSRASRFAPLAAAMVARGWRVLAIDAPGHGLSTGRSSSLPQFMAALDVVATRLGPLQALIGHSLGALAVAARSAPPAWYAALQRMVLISTPADAAFLVDSFQRMLGIEAATAAAMQARFLRRFAAEPASFTALHDGHPPQLATLLVHDRGDDIVPFAHAGGLLPRLRQGRLLATEGLGHSALTRDAATIAAMGDFLEQGHAADAKACVTVRRAQLHQAADAAAIVLLLNAYATDPRGGGVPLPDAVQLRLVTGLQNHPMARVWLAFDDAVAVGVCVGFVGYSTFEAMPLLNIHDLAVLPGQRGRGVGRALLTAAEAEARAEGCCKLTLEVQEDNSPARQLYDRFGFRDVRYGNSGPTVFQSKRL